MGLAPQDCMWCNRSRVCCKRQWQISQPPPPNPSDAWVFLPSLRVHKPIRFYAFWGGPSPPRRPAGDDQQHRWDPQMVILPLFCLCHSLSFPPLLSPISFSSFYSPFSLSYLLLNKIHTIVTGIWSCLHLKLGRGISKNFNNWIMTAYGGGHQDYPRPQSPPTHFQ